MCKEANNKRGMVVTLSNLSNPYSRINQFNRAIKGLDQAFRIINETDDDITKALVLSNYGQVYTKMQKWDKAKKYFEESLSIYEKSKNLYDFAMALFQYGKSLIAGNKIEDAIIKLTQSKELFSKCDAKTKVKEVEDLLHSLETTPPSG
jgi:tetratricopeptide (TPR) repeat protein